MLPEKSSIVSSFINLSNKYIFVYLYDHMLGRIKHTLVISAIALIYLSILLVQHQGIFFTSFRIIRIPCLILTLGFDFQVGMSIDPKLLLSNFPAISVLGLLIFGKTLLVTFVGRLFGVSTIAAIRVGLMLAPGGEFAFVAFGEAVNQVIRAIFL
jgi:hypothetical protein